MRCVLILAALLTSGAAMAADLTVMVNGVRNNEGLLELCLFNRPQAFPDCAKDPAVQRRRLPATPGAMRAVFEGIAPGTYAVTVFHDEKRLGRVETNLLGIPRSGVGASNDPAPRFGPPTFESAAFTMPDRPAQVAITMRYP